MNIKRLNPRRKPSLMMFALKKTTPMRKAGPWAPRAADATSLPGSELVHEDPGSARSGKRMRGLQL